MSENIFADLNNDPASEILEDLAKLIPSWKEVKLSKEAYNKQYTLTMIEVALYVLQREQNVIRKLAVRKLQDDAM